MKKKANIVGFICALIIMVSSVPSSLIIHAQNPRIRVNNEFIQISLDDQQPVIVDNRILVPLRVIMEILEYEVEWDERVQIVSLESPRRIVAIQIGSITMLVNDSIISLDVPAQIMGDRTIVPLRAISEATGMTVLWDEINYIVDILSEGNTQPSQYPSHEPISEENWPEHLPRHVPGSISLRPERYFEDMLILSSPMQYRYIFYSIPGEFVDLVDIYEFNEWVQSISRDNNDAMSLVQFVQHFNISREEANIAAERTRESRQRFNLSDERYEIPIIDIIFTFDDEIIRYYYRRE